jgi:hypothetical protein
MAAQRIYVVAIGQTKRLVRASHPGTALLHVARDLAKVEVAKQEELVTLLAAGTKVEDVKAEQSEIEA